MEHFVTKQVSGMLATGNDCVSVEIMKANKLNFNQQKLNKSFLLTGRTGFTQTFIPDRLRFTPPEHHCMHLLSNWNT